MSEQTQNNAVQIVEIPFHGDILEGALIDGRPMVKLNRFCENLGIDPSSCRKRFDREGIVRTVIMTARDSAGRSQQMLFIDVKDVPFVLATIDVSRCKNREQLVEKTRT